MPGSILNVHVILTVGIRKQEGQELVHGQPGLHEALSQKEQQQNAKNKQKIPALHREKRGTQGAKWLLSTGILELYCPLHLLTVSLCIISFSAK